MPVSGTLIGQMRAAAILGLGCSPRALDPFQQTAGTEWTVGLPAATNPHDAILVFGGDGTLHRHLSALVRLGLPVLVVPAGSGNDFARALGLLRAKDSLAAWWRFLRGSANVRTVDLGVIAPIKADAKSVYFSCAAGVGLDGEISRRANELPRWLRRRGGYAWTLPAALARFRPFAVQLTVTEAKAGEAVVHNERSVVAAVFANTPVYGGGMRIAPRARMDDGLLDACLIRDISKLKLLGVFPSVYFGRHLGLREVEYFPLARVRVETERPMDIYADGERIFQSPVEFSVARQALHVIVP